MPPIIGRMSNIRSLHLTDAALPCGEGYGWVWLLLSGVSGMAAAVPIAMSRSIEVV